jgi:hypothetical protein
VRILFYCFVITGVLLMQGCVVGILLFYRDSRTHTIYKSAASRKNYYEIKATTLSHCGCTSLNVINYCKGKKVFSLHYMNGMAHKTVYGTDTNKNEIIKLTATKKNNYTEALDSMDHIIFKTIDSLALHRPKGTYSIAATNFKGYIIDTVQ